MTEIKAIWLDNLHNGTRWGRMFKCFRCDRQSPLGNPFYMEDESMRDEVCDKYKKYFYETLLYNNEAIVYLNKILQELKQGNLVVLQCWCIPKRCHTETIKEYLEEHVYDKEINR